MRSRICPASKSSTLRTGSCSWPPPSSARRGPAAPRERPDPQSAWHVLNVNIRSFLEGVPAEQKLLLRGEELLTTPDPSRSARIAAFAGVRTNYAAIERMKGVTVSPFAMRGPAGAEYGIDLFLSASPLALAERPLTRGLDGPLPWNTGARLRPEVKQLALDLGYG